MKARRFLKPCLILVGLLVGPAFGLPANRVVHYAIRVDPTNPNSRVQYVLSVTISAQAQDGDWIGWEVESYRITEKALLGSDTVWAIDFPFVDTTDGLWWVEHADPDGPIRPEFVEPAGVIGTAVANDPADPDLYFDVVGVPYTQPPEGAPFEVTGALDFAFWAMEEPPPSPPPGEQGPPPPPPDPPDDKGDDEPVDSPDLPNPPSHSSQ